MLFQYFSIFSQSFQQAWDLWPGYNEPMNFIGVMHKTRGRRHSTNASVTVWLFDCLTVWLLTSYCFFLIIWTFYPFDIWVVDEYYRLLTYNFSLLTFLISTLRTSSTSHRSLPIGAFTYAGIHQNLVQFGGSLNSLRPPSPHYQPVESVSFFHYCHFCLFCHCFHCRLSPSHKCQPHWIDHGHRHLSSIDPCGTGFGLRTRRRKQCTTSWL